MRAVSASVTGSPMSSYSSTTEATSADSSVAFERIARPADAGQREDIVERAGDVLDRRGHLARSASSSTDSMRTRSAASGVLRSWPIAPSITSFSSSSAAMRASMALCATISRRTSSGPSRLELAGRIAGRGELLDAGRSARPAGG